MKKLLLTVAVFGAFATAAQADSSVTVYGIVDAGFMSQSNVPLPAGGTGRQTSFVDAQIAPSIYGIKGSEDLGGGLTAGFVLEGGFNAGNGTHDSQGYQSQIFGRQAKVTLGGDWGTLGAGMQKDPAWVASMETEPRGMANSFSNIAYWISATAGNGGSTGAFTGGMLDQNSITYIYAKNGLYLGLEYGFGGVAGSTAAGQTESIGATYTNSGFIASASYAKANSTDPSGLTGGLSEIDVFGLGYDFGPVALRGQYGEFKSGIGSTYLDDVQSWGIGLDWKVSAANVLNFAYYDAKDKGFSHGGSTTEFAVLDTYSLSKRTQIYAQIAEVNANANAGLSSALGSTYVPGVAGIGRTNYLGVGIQQSF